MTKKKNGGKGKNGSKDGDGNDDWEQFDLFSARAERDLGMERASGKCSEWTMKALTRVKTLPSGYEGITEEIRRDLDLGMPSSSGAVGAFTNYAVKLGLLIKTGEMRPPKGVRSHARATQVWRRP